jgi:hypothetical protein
MKTVNSAKSASKGKDQSALKSLSAQESKSSASVPVFNPVSISEERLFLLLEEEVSIEASSWPR